MISKNPCWNYFYTRKLKFVTTVYRSSVDLARFFGPQKRLQIGNALIQDRSIRRSLGLSLRF